jgi:trehalose 6-phosphate synthase
MSPDFIGAHGERSDTRRDAGAVRGPSQEGGRDRRRLVVAANRGPVTFGTDAAGEPTVRRGMGGLVSALNELFRRRRGTWVAAAQNDEERRLAGRSRAVEVDLDGVPYSVRYVGLDPADYQRYYSVIANPLLWFVQHYLWDPGVRPALTDEEHLAWESYLTVGRAFADEILVELDGDGGDALVMLHDYHLYTVAPRVRANAPRALLHHFVHIPWPQSDYWRVLPEAMRTAVFEGLLGNDIVAFHTERYARSFLDGCADVLDLPVDRRRATVQIGGREVWVRWYPVSIRPETLRRSARSDEVAREHRELQERRPELLLLRVDRLDPSKNVVRGFQAYDLFLERHPEYRGRVTFLALLQPSRQDVREYAEYRDRTLAVVERINARYGDEDWTPVDLRLQDDFRATLAAYGDYDALLVNAVFDGMNLVAKEGCVVNRRDGVLILSENAGAFAELGALAVPVSPFDLVGQAEAIHTALAMPAAERRFRAARLREIVEHNDVERWIGAQLADVARREDGAGL